MGVSMRGGSNAILHFRATCAHQEPPKARALLAPGDALQSGLDHLHPPSSTVSRSLPLTASSIKKGRSGKRPPTMIVRRRDTVKRIALLCVEARKVSREAGTCQAARFKQRGSSRPCPLSDGACLCKEMPVSSTRRLTVRDTVCRGA